MLTDLFLLQADIKDVAKAGPHDFTFKYHNHKHAFQAASATERDGWLVALETRHNEAVNSREGIVGSEGYKSSLEKFGMSELMLWVHPKLTRMILSQTYCCGRY